MGWLQVGELRWMLAVGLKSRRDVGEGLQATTALAVGIIICAFSWPSKQTFSL
jgi:hypothetical protein